MFLKVGLSAICMSVVLLLAIALAPGLFAFCLGSRVLPTGSWTLALASQFLALWSNLLYRAFGSYSVRRRRGSTER